LNKTATSGRGFPKKNTLGVDMPSRDEILESLGYPLDRVPLPGATYKTVLVEGLVAYVSGCLPNDGGRNLVSAGKVPSVVSLEDAKKAAALCAANILRLVRQKTGSLDRISRILKLVGFVNSDVTFTDQSQVVNGASQLMIDVLGEAGWHARSAVGVAQLPLGASVEVEAIVQLK
jgi:enamine deaminase RidA (YjgF/YER057c/UK114 family)